MADSLQSGLTNGSLVIAGGGTLTGSEILKRFVALAGGPQAPIVVMPAASEKEHSGFYGPDMDDLITAGASNLTLLHTRDRNVANSEDFIAPLLQAQGVWFPGGRQWRIADAYLHTHTHQALIALLARGGVIGGTSAGATIQGSYLVRGDTSGNEIIMGDHEEGFGFLPNVAIDQHLLRRNRQFDLIDVMIAHPELLGIGIDEETAIIVTGDEFEVIGRSYVAIYDPQRMIPPHGPFYLLAPGDRYQLSSRMATRPTTHQEKLARVAEQAWTLPPSA